MRDGSQLRSKSSHGQLTDVYWLFILTFDQKISFVRQVKFVFTRRFKCEMN